jgi:hypothetical protein
VKLGGGNECRTLLQPIRSADFSAFVDHCNSSAAPAAIQPNCNARAGVGKRRVGGEDARYSRQSRLHVCFGQLKDSENVVRRLADSRGDSGNHRIVYGNLIGRRP